VRSDNVELAASIRVAQVQVAMDEAVCLAPHVPAREALDLLKAHNFDHAPVLVKKRPRFWVSRAALERSGARYVSDVQEPIETSQLIAAQASIGELVAGLAAADFLFVLDRRDIAGFVTWSDLNKQPVRSYFYLRVAAFEAFLAESIRTSVGDDKAFALLPSDRQATLTKVRAQARHDNHELGWISYFYLDDLLAATRQLPRVREAMGVSSLKRWTDHTEGLPRVRNASVHLVRDLVDSRWPAHELAKVDRHLDQLLGPTVRAPSGAAR